MRLAIAFILLCTFHGARPLLAVSPLNSAVSERKDRGKGVHIPIVPHSAPSSNRIWASSTDVGLGDYFDITYSIRLSVGGVSAPFILDSGSSDLWMISDACSDDCRRGSPSYPQSRLPVPALDIELNYGDSQTGTSAIGKIGNDDVSLGGLSLRDQFFALINTTDTGVSSFGVSGIFGLGFPVNSIVWDQLFLHAEFAKRDLTSQRTEIYPSYTLDTTSPAVSSFRRQSFPTIGPELGQHVDSERRRAGNVPSVAAALASYATIGPFLPRLVEHHELSLPAFFTTLQRDSIDVGGNMGMLSIGEFPHGVSEESLTWAPLRGYNQTEAGLAAPPDSPDEVYPIAWEVFLDGVYLDGERLPESTLSPGINLSALVDTGNSLIRGPQDVVDGILDMLGPDGVFDCAVPHTLSFSIGGKLFPVDPRDLISQPFVGDVGHCMANIAPTDRPRVGGYQFSWSLGTPFLKGVVAAFHYGNLSYPSQDPPKMGFLSTVPSDAGDRLKAAIAAARKADNNFPTVIEVAPTATDIPEVSGTSIDGVPQASPKLRNSGTARLTRHSLTTTWSCAFVLLFVICLRRTW